MQTSHFNRHFAPIQIAFPLTAIHYNPRDSDTPLYSVKRASSSVPLVPAAVHNSLDNADAHLPLTQVCLPPLINSTTGRYNSIGSNSSFSQAYSKGEL